MTRAAPLPLDHDRAPARHGFFRRYLRESSVAIAYALLLLVLLTRTHFFSTGEFANVAVANAYVLVAAVGMTMVIVCRQIDISIGSQLSICCIAAGLMSRADWPIGCVAVGTAGVGLAMGAFNGVLVAYLNVPSIVATLATLVIWRESKRWWNQGETIQNLRADFQWFGLGQMTGQWTLVLIAAGVFVLFTIALRYTRAGRAIYAVGSDREAARLAGIRPRRVTFVVFAMMGFLGALAALLAAVRLPTVDPKTGEGLELQVIAAVVVGGVAISGGRGTLIGALIGVLFLGTIHPALPFLGTEAYWDKAIQGGIILLAVASDALYRRAE